MIGPRGVENLAANRRLSPEKAILNSSLCVHHSVDKSDDLFWSKAIALRNSSKVDAEYSRAKRTYVNFQKTCSVTPVIPIADAKAPSVASRALYFASVVDFTLPSTQNALQFSVSKSTTSAAASAARALVRPQCDGSGTDPSMVV